MSKNAMSPAARVGDRISRSDLSSKMHGLLVRLSRGRLGTRVRGIPVLLLTTEGRRTHKPRTVPLMYYPDAGRMLVVASNAAQPDRPPAWWLNLQANPTAWARTDTGPHRIRAQEVDESEREFLWPHLAEHNSHWARFQAETDRRFPIVALETEPHSLERLP